MISTMLFGGLAYNGLSSDPAATPLSVCPLDNTLYSKANLNPQFPNQSNHIIRSTIPY